MGRALGRTVEYESFYVRKNMRTGDARDTLLYVFNYDDNGFAVVATDRRVNKLLAVAENGPYHPKLIPGMNGYYCGMFFYMTALIDELEALSTRPFTADVPDVPGRVESRETRTVGESAEPAITVEWGYRTWPYNTYCRKSDGTLAPAGSAAAAVAQIMEACSFPERMDLTYPDAEVASADLDWEKIRQHRNTDMCGVWDCPGDHVAISRIYREIGQQLGLEYGDRYDLPMDFGKMPECLRHFGFRADEVAAYDADRVVGSLKEGKLVCMSGRIARRASVARPGLGHRRLSGCGDEVRTVVRPLRRRCGAEARGDCGDGSLHSLQLGLEQRHQRRDERLLCRRSVPECGGRCRALGRRHAAEPAGRHRHHAESLMTFTLQGKGPVRIPDGPFSVRNPVCAGAFRRWPTWSAPRGCAAPRRRLPSR